MTCHCLHHLSFMKTACNLEMKRLPSVTTDAMTAGLKACKDKINYCLQRELDRVKQLFHSKIDDLSQSIVDWLKQLDRQLEQKFKTFKPLMSTPVHSSTSTTHKMSQTSSKIDPVTQNSTKQVTYLLLILQLNCLPSVTLIQKTLLILLINLKNIMSWDLCILRSCYHHYLWV